MEAEDVCNVLVVCIPVVEKENMRFAMGIRHLSWEKKEVVFEEQEITVGSGTQKTADGLMPSGRFSR